MEKQKLAVLVSICQESVTEMISFYESTTANYFPYKLDSFDEEAQKCLFFFGGVVEFQEAIGGLKKPKAPK